jgi:hypothetical protein
MRMKRSFGGIFRLHLQEKAKQETSMKQACFNRAAQRYIPGEKALHNHSWGILQSCTDEDVKEEDNGRIVGSKRRK